MPWLSKAPKVSPLYLFTWRFLCFGGFMLDAYFLDGVPSQRSHGSMLLMAFT